jgi:hypothetical protein
VAFPGYLTFAGNEIVNIDRTLAYAKSIVPRLDVKAPDYCVNLHGILGQSAYTTPADDNAPWYDPNVPDSHGFIGLYPLDVSGLDNDTREATVVESTFDGGFISTPRRKTREVRIRGLLIGEDQGCCDYGLFWLKAILDADVRSVAVGRADPGTETMASIPDICGSERGDVRFLAACPELGCGLHCGHNASGADKAHPIDISKLQPTSGTYQQVSSQWTFTPDDSTSSLRTPLLPDDETCPVRYVWNLSGLPGAEVTGYGIRDGRFSYASDPIDQYVRQNLATNPQWKTTSGVAEVRRNLAINPSMRKTATAVTKITNLVTNPRGATNTTGYAVSSGGGTSALSVVATGGPLTEAPTFVRQSFTVAQTALRAYTSFGLLGSSPEIVVAPNDRVAFSAYLRTSVAGQSWQAQVDFYDAANALVGTSQVGAVTALTANTWTKMEMTTGLAPTGTTKCRLYLVMVGGPFMPIGGTVDSSAYIAVRTPRGTGTSSTHMVAYFDGATAQRGGVTFAWTGTAHASTSTALGAEGVLRVNTVVNPALQNNVSFWAPEPNLVTSLTRTTGAGLSTPGGVITNFARISILIATASPVGQGLTIGAIASQTAVTVQPGQIMTFSLYARSSHFDRKMALRVTFRDSAGVIVGPPFVEGTPQAVGGTQWNRVWVTTMVPPGAAKATLALLVPTLGGGTPWIVGDTMDATAVLAEASQNADSYFDGNTATTPDIDYLWTGTAGNSSSQARTRQTTEEVTARVNWAINPQQDSRFPSGMVSDNAALYPLTASGDVTTTARTATTPSAVASSVAISGGSTNSLTGMAATAFDLFVHSCEVTAPVGRTATAVIQYRDNAGVIQRTSTPRTFPMTGQPVVVWNAMVAPSGTTLAFVTLGVAVTADTGNAATGEVVTYDNLLIEKFDGSLSPTVSGPRSFFCGSSLSVVGSGLNPVWEGTPGQSRSLAVGRLINTTAQGNTGVALYQSSAVSPTGGSVGQCFLTPLGFSAILMPTTDTPSAPGRFYGLRLSLRVVGAATDANATVNVVGSGFAGTTNQGQITQSKSVTLTNNWQEVSLASTAATLAGNTSVGFTVARTGTWSDANARLEIGDIIWEQVGAIGAPSGPFFDGSSLDVADLDYTWSGTPDASASVANATIPTSGGSSTVPLVYRSTAHASSGYSVILPSAGAYIEPTHLPEPDLNGLVPGKPTVIAFDAFQSTGHVGARLYYTSGGAPSYIETVLTAPQGRVEATAVVPSGSITAYWRIVNLDGDAAYVSRVVIEANASTSGEFFDGSTPPAVWTGTPNASTSILTPPPVTVYLPVGEANDGQPSFSSITSEAAVVVNSVTAYYYEPPTVALQTSRYWRTLRAGTCTDGPTITQEFASVNAVLKQVEFTIVTPDPWAYGSYVNAATVVGGAATSTASGVTVAAYTPGTTDLTCYAEDIAYIPMDPNCGTIPRPPRPDPVGPCSSAAVTRGLLFFIPPTLLEERAATYPRITFNTQTFNRDRFIVRCWPLPSAGATLEDISACDTRGWLQIGDVIADRGFILDCATRRGTLVGVPVTGGKLNLEATHWIYPPASVPFTAGADYDPIPLTWPEMYGGNYGYFVLIEYAANFNLSCVLDLVTRR